MPMGVLKGHAIKAQVLPGDHTYVTSNTGQCWECFGRSSGGSQICQGNGNVAQADCLSRPKGRQSALWVYAGVVYGVTGVCHQAANRILFPAQELVFGATGFPGSVFAWGVYGKGHWPELWQCILTHNHP